MAEKSIYFIEIITLIYLHENRLQRKVNIYYYIFINNTFIYYNNIFDNLRVHNLFTIKYI